MLVGRSLMGTQSTSEELSMAVTQSTLSTKGAAANDIDQKGQ